MFNATYLIFFQLFDRELCCRQLRYSGMMETIRIRRAGQLNCFFKYIHTSLQAVLIILLLRDAAVLLFPRQITQQQQNQ